MRLLQGETIQGSKGGSAKAHTPVEQPDDLLSTAKLKMLLAIAEGEIQGDLTAQQIFLNDTPLANQDGSYNFTGVVWDFRPGSQDQTYIQGMPEIDNELSVGIEIKQNTPWTRQLSNLQLDAVRIKLSLPVQVLYKDNGDRVGTSTEYAIDLSTDGAAWQTVVNTSFTGKTTSEYQRDHRINLPRANTGWAVRVRRITPDSTSQSLINAFKVFSYAEVIDSKLRYPNTALLFVEVDAQQFNGAAPKITCKPKGRKIRVPSNYNPATREYSGSWNGEFVWAWTNNPAWIFYDLVLNKIFGMGNRVDATMIDRWELYAIAQYCDEKVSDGAGGTEPRFTCDVYIQSQQDAYTVLKDIAAIFRGITFWGNNEIFVNADVPQVDAEGNVDPDYVYHASNVVSGLFTRAGGSYKNRYSSCQVSYSDQQNHYSDTVETVYDSDLVARYDVQEMQLTAIGCTSQSEAHRRGRWALLSNAKDGSISFGVGLDGHIPLPASIIGVADPFFAGKENGGRINAIDGRNVKLDREIEYKAGDRLVINLPDGTGQVRTIGSISADKRTVTVNTNWTINPVAGGVWAIDSDSLAIQYYRVTSVLANDDGTFTVSGIEHDPTKYRYIDDGVRIDSPPVTVTPVNVMNAPQNVVISESSYVVQGLTVASLNAAWDKVDGAIRYQAQWRKDNGDWINVSQTSAQGFSVQGIYSGLYDVRVRAVNAGEVSSPWGYADSTALNGKVGRPGTPTNLLASDNVIFNINVTWAFPEGSGDTAYTEIQQSTTADNENAQLLALVPYPSASYQHGPLAAGIRRWYRARLIDRIGNVGGWTDFVTGMSSTDAEAILTYLTGQINETQLAQDLLSKINNAITEEELADVRSDIGETKGHLGSLAEGVLNNIIAIKDNDELIRELSAQTGQNVATIYQKLQVLTSADSAFAQQLDVIGAQMANNTAAITTEQTARVEGDLALASRITLLDASVGDNSAAILAEQTARVEGDTANAQAITDLSTTVGQNTAQITNLSEVVSDISGSVATQLDGVNASNHNNAEANLFQAVSEVLADASVTTLTKAVANNEVASAQKIETLTAQMNDTKAQVQTTAAAVTTLSGQVTASYNIKVGVTSGGAYYGTGMAIGLSNETGTVQSQVLFSTDRFAILPGSTGSASSAVAPFVLDGGQVFMNSAVIKDGFITNAMIGSYIQSNNYVANTSGWQINKSGTFYINGTAGTGKMVITNTLIQIYDNNNVLRVRMGLW